MVTEGEDTIIGDTLDDLGLKNFIMVTSKMVDFIKTVALNTPGCGYMSKEWCNTSKFSTGSQRNTVALL